MIAFFRNSQKILGMNARNLQFIRPNNLRRAKRFADDKLLSKRELKKADLPVPNLIARIKSLEELENFDWNSLPESFVLKPNRGFGGEGILVVYGKKKPARIASQSDAGGNAENTWIKADGSLITSDDIRTHVTNIIDGSYSLSGVPDIAFFEERLKLLKLFKPYAFKGIPDIRIIVYNKVPMMAMLRLPTRDSDGKANLQQGAVGVGIDMASGVTTTAVFRKNTIIEYLPGTRLVLSGIRIPYWKNILHLAVRAQEISGLGFLGADIALDRDRGPVFLELNARPGLSIQIANLDGLLGRLQRVEGLKIKTAEKGVAVGMNLFGGEIEEEIEDISGKKIIGLVEKIKLIGKEGKEIEVEAKIDTGAGLSSIDTGLAKELGFEKTVEEYDKLGLSYEKIKNMPKNDREKLFAGIPDLADTAIIHSSHGTTHRPMINVEISMDSFTILAKVSIIDRSNLKYPVILGWKNLRKFLIDSSK
jgi:alpha-L-glutamate ligase-like protein